MKTFSRPLRNHRWSFFNRNRLVRLMLVIFATLVVVQAAAAQGNTYRIDWWTVDNGGGQSNGSGYTLISTAGQLDAGKTMTGGSYVLVGGFEAGLLTKKVTPIPPVVPMIDTDGDTIPDNLEGTSDYDNDGKPNTQDEDSDNDTIPDLIEGSGDDDGDGQPNFVDTDADNDGLADQVEGTADSDGDGVPNYLDEAQGPTTQSLYLPLILKETFR